MTTKKTDYQAGKQRWTKKPLAELQQSTRIQRFHVRAITHGVEYTTCPFCGNKNRTQLSPDNYIISCTGSGCGARFAAGRILYPLPPGRPRMPCDWVAVETNDLRESFPAGELNRDPWRSGDRVHRVMMDARAVEVATVERFFERAGVGLTQPGPWLEVGEKLEAELRRMQEAMQEGTEGK